LLLIAYLGANYGGLQRNPGRITVESVLHDAIVQAGGISQDNSDEFGKVHWQSCARTDKGVSALGNVIGLKMATVPDLVSKVNDLLPQDIRVFDMIRVGKRFNPKNRCCSRKYTYVMPTSVFTPSRYYQGEKRSDKFVFDTQMEAHVNTILKIFEGTHNFHNFTAKGGPKEFKNPSAMRFIMSAKCSSPFMIDGEEWVEMTFLGQSFILYQIRKMVGITICIARDGATPRVILACFEKPKKKASDCAGARTFSK